MVDQKKYYIYSMVNTFPLFSVNSGKTDCWQRK